MTQMHLSEHITLAEMVRSQAATRKGLPNDPPEKVVDAMRLLCCNVVEPIRALVREKIRPKAVIAVSSGYRSPAVNRDVGGDPISQHTRGEAVDFEVPGVDNLTLAHLIADSDVPFDQLILEFHVPGVPASGWIHVSHAPSGRQRRQVLHYVRERGTAKRINGLPPRPVTP